MPHIPLAIVIMVLYLIVAGLQLLWLNGKAHYYKTAGLLVGYVTVILHGYLLHHWIDVDSGQNLTLVNMFSLAGWLASLLLLLTALFKPIEALIVFIFPLTALSIVAALLFPGSQIINTAHNLRDLFHILLAVLTFSVLCIAGWQAILLAMVEKKLHDKSTSIFVRRLPPVQTMENLLFQTICFGFLLLTITIASSIYFFDRSLTLPVLQKTILAITGWIIFGCLLLGRYYFGWRGRKAVYGTLIGVVVLVIIYFGSILLLELLI